MNWLFYISVGAMILGGPACIVGIIFAIRVLSIPFRKRAPWREEMAELTDLLKAMIGLMLLVWGILAVGAVVILAVMAILFLFV
ncbi:hypothetical protein [Neorhizobium galegae]|uniref:hypothetical protein n=1 Tax=Neorhizobium galegae TaxID=399 RepID=UPI000621D5B3|nr:hypothetical protein [Neorhizobium galegae]KAB1125911.1 hypothetical protein F4V90_01930 [Neorhizobium galegae]MCQ1806186.1 hypothetical protein [Neorhizobium galegae]CDZ55527.1 Hypothetical protein NGAL_HAMBI2566_01570 [Neorhizobium galegae bv. orientalis]